MQFTVTGRIKHYSETLNIVSKRKKSKYVNKGI